MRVDTTIEVGWRSVLGRLMRSFVDRGLFVHPGFDLQRARRDEDEGVGVLCPHHGTRDCRCQYVILQVSGRDEGPSAVIVHGGETATRIALRTRAGARGRLLAVAAICETVGHFRSAARAVHIEASYSSALPLKQLSQA